MNNTKVQNLINNQPEEVREVIQNFITSPNIDDRTAELTQFYMMGLIAALNDPDEAALTIDLIGRCTQELLLIDSVNN